MIGRAIASTETVTGYVLISVYKSLYKVLGHIAAKIVKYKYECKYLWNCITVYMKFYF